jgi:hypothetical protein
MSAISSPSHGSQRAPGLPMTGGMTKPEIVKAVPGPPDDTAVGHLAIIAEMHSGALAHIACLAESWQAPASGSTRSVPTTQEILALRPPAEAGGTAAT